MLNHLFKVHLSKFLTQGTTKTKEPLATFPPLFPLFPEGFPHFRWDSPPKTCTSSPTISQRPGPLPQEPATELPDEAHLRVRLVWGVGGKKGVLGRVVVLFFSPRIFWAF